MSWEFLFGLNIKLFSVTMKMSAKFASEAKFYMDFEPFTFGQWIKKTLYVCINIDMRNDKESDPETTKHYLHKL